MELMSKHVVTFRILDAPEPVRLATRGKPRIGKTIQPAGNAGVPDTCVLVSDTRHLSGRPGLELHRPRLARDKGQTKGQAGMSRPCRKRLLEGHSNLSRIAGHGQPDP